ncbi:MAG TPA: phage integrase SAM-like domain-containing protein [Chitinophagaceae bacterium]|nr:phage integrase SAM-like domain-containing protein [Chitinophagaceae bacterium]
MFILDRPSSKEPTFIFIKTTLSDGLFKRSLGLKILPVFWDGASKRAVITGLDRSTTEDNKSINNRISKVEGYIEQRERDARYNGKHLTCSEMDTWIKELTGKKVKGTSMFAGCRQIIEDMESGLLLTDRGKRFSDGTIKNYNQCLDAVENYDDKLTFERIDLTFYRSFIKWCNDKEWSLNYIATHIKNVRRLLRQSCKRGLHNNRIWENEEFRVIQEENDDIALDMEELKIIYEKRLLNRGLDIARDWFIIGSFTGLRVMDIQLLDDEKHFSKDYLQIVNEKTDTKVVIPIHPYVRKIKKKYNGLPPKISDQELNRAIKKVCELSKINDPVIYSITKGGARIDYYLRKCDLVSCHTMRRCSITNMLNGGIPDNQVMQVHGIKKHSTLLRYKKTKPEDTAKIMKNHSYYQ